MQKPIDRWFGLVATALGIGMTWIPKTPLWLISSLVLMFMLLIHPVWNFWWIEETKSRRLISVLLLCVALFVLGSAWWPKGSFQIDVKTSIVDPNFIYLSSDKEIIPTKIALFIKVTNRGSSTNKIDSYGVKVLIPDLNSGKIVEKWYKLKAIQNLDSNVYYALSKGFLNCRRMNLDGVDFLEIAKTIHLQPDDHISGWIFFETNKDIDARANRPLAIEISLKDTSGNVQTHRHELYNNKTEPKQEETSLEPIINPYASFKVLEVADLSNYKIRPLPEPSKQKNKSGCFFYEFFKLHFGRIKQANDSISK